MKYSTGKVFRFRLTLDEHEELTAKAAEAGLSKADFIRQALGWELQAAPSLDPGPQARALLERTPEGPVDPEAEPAKAAMQRIADRTRAALSS